LKKSIKNHFKPLFGWFAAFIPADGETKPIAKSLPRKILKTRAYALKQFRFYSPSIKKAKAGQALCSANPFEQKAAN
jgi:hypothetical protein